MTMRSHPPEDMGPFELPPQEFMFVMYMPIVMPNLGGVRLPEHLAGFRPMAEYAASLLCGQKDHLYLTVKHMFAPAGVAANRPGWHADGFGTDDLNVIWYNDVPTEFCVQDFDVGDDDAHSMVKMEQQVRPENIRTYPAGHLYLLDSTTVHRPAVVTQDTIRMFVKFSVSPERYALAGNAHNPLFKYDWPLAPRALARNMP